MNNGTINMDLEKDNEVIQEAELVETQVIKSEDSEVEKDPFFNQLTLAKKYQKEAMSIVVTDSDQIEDMVRARELRFELRDIRVEMEKQRVLLKKDIVRRGKAIDGCANIVKAIIEPLEEHLKLQEKFIEIQEEKQKQLLKEKREAELLKYEVIDSSFYNLSEMPEDHYQQILKSTKESYDLKKQKELEEENQKKVDKMNQRKEQLLVFEIENIDKHDLLNMTDEEFQPLLKLTKDKYTAKKANDREKEEAKRRKAQDRQDKLFHVNVKLNIDECAAMTDKAFHDLYTEKKKEFELLEADRIKEETARIEKENRDREEREKLSQGGARNSALSRINVIMSVDECADLTKKQFDDLYAEKKIEFDLEQKRIENEKEDQRKAELAPDKEKLNSFAVYIQMIDTPILKSEKANKVLQNAIKMLGDVSSMIKQESLKL